MAEQNARIEDGSGNIIVQADNSTVTVGVPATLRLVPWHLRPQPRPAGSDIALLNPFTLSVPFVGRAAELAQLEATLDRIQPNRDRLPARAGTGVSLLLVEGEPGIGKSRLLSEVVQSALRRGIGVGAARGFETEVTRPFGVWSALSTPDGSRHPLVELGPSLASEFASATREADACANQSAFGDGFASRFLNDAINFCYRIAAKVGSLIVFA